MTGLRVSEVLNMKWSDIDLESARLTLPKTKTGRRIVPLSSQICSLLNDLPRINDTDWVFAGKYAGTHISYKTLRTCFHDASETAELQDVKLHDLRRSVATNLAASGANAFILRDVLGHSTVAMSSRYVRQASDALREAHEKAAEIMSAQLNGTQSVQ